MDNISAFFQYERMAPFAWWLLILAGILEWGWAVGLKFAWNAQGFHGGPALGSFVCLCGSIWLLAEAQRFIPIGTAYAVWTGIGATGVFVIGVCFFQEALTVLRVFFAAAIVAGTIGLNLTSSH